MVYIFILDLNHRWFKYQTLCVWGLETKNLVWSPAFATCLTLSKWLFLGGSLGLCRAGAQYHMPRSAALKTKWNMSAKTFPQMSRAVQILVIVTELGHWTKPLPADDLLCFHCFHALLAPASNSDTAELTLAISTQSIGNSSPLSSPTRPTPV